MRSIPGGGTTWTIGVAGAVVALAVSGAACYGQGARAGPHVDHVTLPTHKTWRVVSVQPYEGLAEIELVRFDWPTREAPSIAFALTKEGLSVGDPVCLDHVREIDTYWAHPVPVGGCEAFGQTKPAGQP
jgi:hypothetical protein